MLTVPFTPGPQSAVQQHNSGDLLLLLLLKGNGISVSLATCGVIIAATSSTATTKYVLDAAPNRSCPA
jgi:hypothetical protein